MKVALILARGGSKGVYKKNIYPILDKPLIAYTIEAAKDVFGENVYVSTDDDEIANISSLYGAKIIKRPSSLSQDDSKSEDAILHFASEINFDIITFIQPTSPLLKSKYILEGIECMNDSMIDSVFSVTKKHWLPEWDLIALNKDGIKVGRPSNFTTDKRPRRQDVDEKYIENGAFYITRRNNLLSSGLRYSGNIAMIEMPESESFQVDSYEDIKIIKSLLNNKILEK
jgi:CMP-N-acetylneuraminic acid synthetase